MLKTRLKFKPWAAFGVFLNSVAVVVDCEWSACKIWRDGHGTVCKNRGQFLTGFPQRLEHENGHGKCKKKCTK